MHILYDWLKQQKKYRWVYLVARRIRYICQYFTRGFSDQQLWSFDVTLAEYILPRLIRYKEITNGMPFCKELNRHYTEEEWNTVLEKMIFAMQYVKELDQLTGSNSSEKHKQYEEGITLFAKHFINLWL